jgi:hypothetical protein
MPEITRELLRKRAEHNEGILTTLEEVSLHQEELESINEVLGTTCRKLKVYQKLLGIFFSDNIKSLDSLPTKQFDSKNGESCSLKRFRISQFGTK